MPSTNLETLTGNFRARERIRPKPKKLSTKCFHTAIPIASNFDDSSQICSSGFTFLPFDSRKTRTNNTDTKLLSLLYTNTLMAYVQVEADDVRIYSILLFLLQRLIFIHSNGSRKGQKLSSSNVLLAVFIRDQFD